MRRLTALLGLSMAFLACSVTPPTSTSAPPDANTPDAADADVTDGAPRTDLDDHDIPQPEADTADVDANPDADADTPESWPQYPQFVPSEHDCQRIQSFAGGPPLTPRQRELNAQRPDPSIPYGTPIPPEALPTVQCDLEVGCPSLVRSFQLSVGAGERYRLIESAIATASGRVVTERRMTSLTWDGQQRWEVDDLALFHPVGIAGTEDVLAWYTQQGGEGEPKWVYRGLTRIDGEGQFVWTQPMLGHSKVAVFPEHDLAVIPVNPDDCPYRDDESVANCHPGLLLLRLSDGAFVRCVDGHFGGSWDPVANRRYALTTTRDELYVIGDLAFKWYNVVTGESGRVPYSTGVDVPVQYVYGFVAGLNNARPIVLGDGTIFGRTASGYAHWSKEAGMLQEWSWITDPTVADPVSFPGPPTLHYDGSLYQALGGGLMRLADSPARPGDDVPLSTYVDNGVRPYWAPVILQDGTVLVFSFRHVVAYAPGGFERIWSILHGANVSRLILFGDDGTFMLANELGQVTWWSHVHGGLAHTPSPSQDFNSRNDARAPAPPFPTQPEILPAWRRPEPP